MANNQENLVPLTTEKAREIGRKGGLASGKAKREKKEMREILAQLMEMPLHEGKADDVERIKSFAGLAGKNITTKEAILIKQVQKALHGDMAATEFVRDTIGEKPTDKMKVDMAVPIFDGEDQLQD